MFLPHPRVKVSIVGSLRDREVACSASDRQGLNFESCVWRTVSSQSSHHPQEVLLAQFSLYVHKGGLKPDSFHFISFAIYESGCLLFIALVACFLLFWLLAFYCSDCLLFLFSFFFNYYSDCLLFIYEVACFLSLCLFVFYCSCCLIIIALVACFLFLCWLACRYWL